MKKRCWTITAPGWLPFQMVILGEAVDADGALEIARGIWPQAQVE